MQNCIDTKIVYYQQNLRLDIRIAFQFWRKWDGSIFIYYLFFNKDFNYKLYSV